MQHTISPEQIGDPFGRHEPPRRRGVIASVALVTFALGVLVGTRIDEFAERSASPTPKRVPAAAWTPTKIPVGDLCESEQAAAAAVTPMPGGSSDRARLADYVLDRSPVPRFRLATQGWTMPQRNPRAVVPQVSDPTADLVAQGATDGYMKGFNDPDAPGGFTVAAFEFEGVRAARMGAAAAYRTAVCELVRDPIAIPDAPFVLAVTSEAWGSHLMAWTVVDARVIQLSFMIGDHPDRDVRDAMTVLRAALSFANPAAATSAAY